MGFVGNYAPRGLSPQTDGMPVIPEKDRETNLRFHGPFLDSEIFLASAIYSLNS